MIASPASLSRRRTEVEFSPTVVSFADGSVSGRGTVVLSERRSDGAVIVSDRTPFHPVDHTWPDQPGDTGMIASDAGSSVPVREAVMAAISDSGELAVGDEIPVKRGADGWTWLVGHRVPALPSWASPGAAVRLEADADRRAALSRGHTACHLASLALDAALADLWRKDPGADALGNPDFEARANQSSRIQADSSVDEYRLGKSLRKAGFDTDRLPATLMEREDAINATLAAWVASGAVSRIETDGPSIVDSRRWRCELPEGEAVILCGGTHVRSLDEFASITVAMELSGPQSLVMTTMAVRAS